MTRDGRGSDARARLGPPQHRELDDADYLGMVEQKTGWYTFLAPVHVGAIAAGPDEQLEPWVARPTPRHRVSDHGRPLNLRADPEEYGKEIGGDLWEGKRTLMFLHALRNAGGRDHQRAVGVGQAATKRR